MFSEFLVDVMNTKLCFQFVNDLMYLHLMKAISKLANGIQLLFEFSLVQVRNHLRYVCNFEFAEIRNRLMEMNYA